MNVSFMEKVELAGHIERKVKSLEIKDNGLEFKVYEDFERQLKREFGLSKRHQNLKQKYLSDAHDFIDCYEVPTYLLELIEEANAQMNRGVA